MDEEQDPTYEEVQCVPIYIKLMVQYNFDKNDMFFRCVINVKPLPRKKQRSACSSKEREPRGRGEGEGGGEGGHM